MTERDYGDGRDYPDGSVGRYVRERWGARPPAPRPYIAPVQQPRPQPEPPQAPLHQVPPPVEREPDPYDDDLDAELDLDAQPDVDPGYDYDYEPTRPVVVDSGPGATASPTIPGQSRVIQEGQADLRSARAPMRPPHLPDEDITPPNAAAVAPAPAQAPRRPSPAPRPKRAPRGSPVRDPLPEVPNAPSRTTRPPGVLFGGGPEEEDVPPPPRTPPRGSGRWTDPAAVAAQEAQRARSVPPQPPDPDLSSARLLRATKRPPQSGWRRLVYVLSGRLINPGESPTDIRRRELTARVNQPLLGCYKIAMLSLKGGVGKTTVTATLGSTFASLRGDRVVAVDANPDRGTLSQKIPLETSATVRHLLRDAQRVRRYTDVRAYTSQGPSRLEVLASEQDPAVSEAFSEDDYRRTVTLLEHFYNIVLTDCGTGLMHSAMYGVLGVADQLIIVSSGSIDGARSASATMDWLDAHGHQDLVRNSVAVINCVHRSSGGVDLDRVAEHFSARCRAVVRIPFDSHLEEGAEVDLDRLEPTTRLALLELAATVADVFEGVPTH
jgi:MinD-like ATPase involved in chromosome partitioning or flagellar assembly